MSVTAELLLPQTLMRTFLASAIKLCSITQEPFHRRPPQAGTKELRLQPLKTEQDGDVPDMKDQAAGSMAVEPGSLLSDDSCDLIAKILTIQA